MRTSEEPLKPEAQRPTPSAKNHGAVSVMAMMYLVIFSSLATAMAIVAQGNLATADSHQRINRALAGAETGMRFLIYRINQITPVVTTTDGLIDETNAPDLWEETRDALLASMELEPHNLAEPVVINGTLQLGPIALGPNDPQFTATLTPHPLAGEDYDNGYYQRPPFSNLAPPVSAAKPLGTTWVRVRVISSDGAGGNEITRSIQMDFHIDKKIRFAILSRSRVMIGQNVLIDGPIGSRFTETNLTNGHPIQMVSDFVGLDATLNAALDAFVTDVVNLDQNGDNRLNLADANEIDGIINPEQFDTDGDGYIDGYDFFLDHYDANADGQLTSIELDTSGNIHTAQLFELIDTFGDSSRAGYNDGVIDDKDDYAKIHGHVKLLADLQGWLDGAAGGTYQDYLQGSINPDDGENPLTFQTSDSSVPGLEASDFDTSSFAATASGDFATQAAANAALYDSDDPTSPQLLGNTSLEAVPFGSMHPYDYYDRPIYENMTFTNVTILRGNNGLFINCRFIGVTFIDTTQDTAHDNFNFAGTQESDGSQKYPGLTAIVDANLLSNTKPVANNLRFHSCTFEGAVVSGVPSTFAQARNKLNFTGTTRWEINESTNLSDDEKEMYERSTLLSPHFSVEMGTFTDPTDAAETLELNGAIVVGLLDARGQIKIKGTILSTFAPTSNVPPVLGQTSSQFNTTLGYFPSTDGDLEAELPANGVGVIHVTYDPIIPLPDGILGPIEVVPVYATYFEGG